jgi:hypothetical protein
MLQIQGYVAWLVKKQNRGASMSRHRFKTELDGRPILVDMGFDRLLRGFFMVITRADAGADEDTCLYDNLSQQPSHPNTLVPFLEALERLHIHVPEEMINEIETDQLLNVGNKYVEHYYSNGGYMRVPVIKQGRLQATHMLSRVSHG